jgi:hypothetical protein
MARQTTLLDEVANDLAVWIDDMANQIAVAMTPQGVAPFSAQLTEKEKLEYYRTQLFNRDGSPNTQGRSAQLQRLGPEGFAQVYKAVVTAHPELRPSTAIAAPAPPLTPPPAGGGLPVRAYQEGGVVTEPTIAILGEAGPEAVVPLSSDVLAVRDVRAQILRDAGWREDAIQQALNVPINVQPTTSEGGELGVYQQTSVGPVVLPGSSSIDIYSPAIENAAGAFTTTGDVVTPANIYEHEAHHAVDLLDPVTRNRLLNHGQDAATVLADINAVRQYAAVRGDTRLFDTANQALYAYQNDPAHVNHWLVHMAALQDAPDWYRNRYFNYLLATPEWSGAEPSSAPISGTMQRGAQWPEIAALEEQVANRYLQGRSR